MNVLANGVFDVLHVGHLAYLRECRKLGTLIVSVTRDEHVNKGPGRPVTPLNERVEMLRALNIAATVIPCNDLLDAMQQAKPDVVVKGCEYQGRMLPKDLEYMQEHGIVLAFTFTMLKSSSAIIDGLRRS